MVLSFDWNTIHKNNDYTKKMEKYMSWCAHFFNGMVQKQI